MIIREEMIIASNKYIRTYSDQHVYIKRNGDLYEEAIDPIELAADRIYTETDIPIEHGPKIEEPEEVQNEQ